MKAVGIAPLAKEQLADNKSLSIHSKFKNSMNLLSGNKLIYIGERALPFGLQLKSFKDVKNSLKVYYKENQLVFVKVDSKMYIQVDELQLIDDQHQGELYCLSPKLSRLNEFVEQKSLKELDFYLGRGKGLTPSGDDFLVGIYCVSFCNQQLAEKMKSLKDTDFKDFTTSISAAYLDAARKGHFNPELIALLKTKNPIEFEKHITNIIEIGHNSGMDTLEGVTLGLNMIQMGDQLKNENRSSIGW